MWMGQLEEQVIKLSSESEKARLQAFLEKQGLAMDKDIEYSMVLMDGGRIVATGSFFGRVLKCIAIDDEYRDQGLSARVLTHLTNEQFRSGRKHLFIYTKPWNRKIFTELGYYPVAEVTDKVILMENRPDGIERYLDELVKETGTVSPAASVVVNCNPFTLGHKYLLEYAAARCQLLHVFVVWEDNSVFPVETRYRLVEKGVEHLHNVVLHKGRDYIISNATFPSYFIKKYEDLVETHARLDIGIFAKHIASTLKIKKRFVGEEPYCLVTAAYNNLMKQILPPNGIEVEEIPRITYSGSAISASRVRELIRHGDMDAVKELVPDTTYQFLISLEAEEIIRRIRTGSWKS